MHQQQFCHLDAKCKKEFNLTVNILCFSELTFCILVIQFTHGKRCMEIESGNPAGMRKVLLTPNYR